MLKWYLVWFFASGGSGYMQMPNEAACLAKLAEYRATYPTVIASCQQGI